MTITKENLPYIQGFFCRNIFPGQAVQTILEGKIESPELLAILGV